MIVAVVLIGATLLVGGVFGILLLVAQLGQPAEGPSQFAVGDCVVQDGNNAKQADCTAPEAFEIISEVDTMDDCPDPTQPALAVSDPERVYCLAPANADETE